MQIIFDPVGSVDSFIKFLDKIEKSDAKSVLIFSCDENGYTKEDIDEVLKRCSIKIFERYFPSDYL